MDTVRESEGYTGIYKPNVLQICRLATAMVRSAHLVASEVELTLVRNHSRVLAI